MPNKVKQSAAANSKSKKKAAAQLTKSTTGKSTETSTRSKASPGKKIGCPGNHDLKQFTKTNGYYGCNLCLKRFRMVFGCRACNWDVCTNCTAGSNAESESSNRTSPDKGVKRKA